MVEDECFFYGRLSHLALILRGMCVCTWLACSCWWQPRGRWERSSKGRGKVGGGVRSVAGRSQAGAGMQNAQPTLQNLYLAHQSHVHVKVYSPFCV